jgi:mono/diheme cytochrome c family protein
MKRFNFRILAYPLAVLLTGIFMAAFVAPGDNVVKDWDVPAKYKEMKNPHAGDEALDKVGKMMYAKHCKSCHGNVGLGDGAKAASMEAKMIPFNDPKFQAQSDGVIYFQSIVGRGEMPNFEKKIPEEEDRWALINFIRTLK